MRRSIGSGVIPVTDSKPYETGPSRDSLTPSIRLWTSSNLRYAPLTPTGNGTNTNPNLFPSSVGTGWSNGLRLNGTIA